MRIDAHQHFWIFDPAKDAWIGEGMEAIQRDFLPTDLAQTLKDNRMDGAIAVQAAQSHQETQFLLDLSTMYAMVKGIVGWVDLQSDRIDEHLRHFSQYPLIKGFRHIVEGEPDPDFLMRPAVQNGIKHLAGYGYTFDLLVRPMHHAVTLACAEVNPEQRFVLDHMAKPNVSAREFDDWAAFIEKLAALPNVWCKISGLMTEADWKNWKPDDFAPYVSHVLSRFGKGRVMFGSDWPVCLLAGSYRDAIRIAEEHLSGFSPEEKEGFWGGNAARFYGI